MNMLEIKTPRMAVCHACRGEFGLKAEDRYTAFAVGVGFDAFDCPYCGCQNVAGSRLSTDESDAGCVDSFLSQLLCGVLDGDDGDE